MQYPADAVIARSLVQTARLVIFHEPTPRVRRRVIADRHRSINELAGSGIGVIVISSVPAGEHRPGGDNRPVDRIWCRGKGQIVKEFLISEATEEKIMYAEVH